VAEEFVPAVEATGIGAEEPSHAGDEIGLRRLDHQMKMIAHQTIRMDAPAGLGAGFREGFKETDAVVVVLEDGFTAVTAIHHVIDRSGVLDSQLAGHDGRQ
jgi:septum formation inhibitor-activating ATPase MinD